MSVRTRSLAIGALDDRQQWRRFEERTNATNNGVPRGYLPPTTGAHVMRRLAIFRLIALAAAQSCDLTSASSGTGCQGTTPQSALYSFSTPKSWQECTDACSGTGRAGCCEGSFAAGVSYCLFEPSVAVASAADANKRAVMCAAAPPTAASAAASSSAPATNLFTVVSGPCTTSSNGNCVSDGDGSYSNSERCTIRTNSAITISVREFNTEECCDHLTVAGVRFSGTRSPSGLQVRAISRPRSPRLLHTATVLACRCHRARPWNGTRTARSRAPPARR